MKIFDDSIKLEPKKRSKEERCGDNLRSIADCMIRTAEQFQRGLEYREHTKELQRATRELSALKFILTVGIIVNICLSVIQIIRF